MGEFDQGTPCHHVPKLKKHLRLPSAARSNTNLLSSVAQPKHLSLRPTMPLPERISIKRRRSQEPVESLRKTITSPELSRLVLTILQILTTALFETRSEELQTSTSNDSAMKPSLLPRFERGLLRYPNLQSPVPPPFPEFVGLRLGTIRKTLKSSRQISRRRKMQKQHWTTSKQLWIPVVDRRQRHLYPKRNYKPRDVFTSHAISIQA